MSFKAEQSVQVKGMAMPGVIVSGPHSSPGADRWLVRKADGNVSLMKAADLTAMDARRELVASALFADLVSSRRAWDSLPETSKESYRKVADSVLKALDKDMPTKPGPLKAGDRIRILKDRHDGATVQEGDVLTVTVAPEGSGTFRTNAPRATYTSNWFFLHANEGIGWERA
ncbi:hypothetical protein [Streptomyces globisporus]|uniref:hypothetical protein n=1 Tax=Streptomyces globisporus TaxID=1908 RepID=UPI0038139319